jgi:RHS repeat-associated protein
VLYEIQGKPYIPIHDHRGCVVVLVDLETKKIEHYRYSAFGEELTGNTFSPWRFASKRVDAETDLIFFGRRYYHPSLGRFITQDPQGFEEGPNLYAYLKNCPMADLDPYGLYSWREMWGDSRDFCYGAGSFAWGGVRGIGYGMGKMGEWMHADFQYEHFNDRSFFQDKSYRAIEAWKSIGRAAWNDPLGLLAPGIMEAWRNPRSAEAWGRATVDIATLGLTVGKIGQVSKVAQRVGRIAEEGAAFDKTIRANEIIGGAYNRATHEIYKNNLRSQMSKPYATDHNLNRILDYAYRPNATVGSGSTAAAIRHEKLLGKPLEDALIRKRAKN